ncbi:MAG: hypothetical protein AB7P07_00960 [Hyphomonadaceae bacterium]
MKRYDLIFLGAALTCLLIGEGLGIYMGISQDFLMVPAHVHLNLLGWSTLGVFGVLHRIYPALGASRLALPQCVLAIVMNIAMPAGLAVLLLTQDATLVKFASLGVILATLMFILMFARKAPASGAPA